jgi:serine protease Do
MKSLTLSQRARWVGLLAVGLWSLCPRPSIGQDDTLLQTLEGEILRIVDRVKPSVVTVVGRFSTAVETPDVKEGLFGIFADKRPPRKFTYVNVASGLVIDSTGHIITKTSVVDGADSIGVQLYDGRTHSASLVGSDPTSGLAVIRVDGVEMYPPPISSEATLRVGAWLTIIGNSLGVSPSVSVGLVNGLRNDGMIQLSGHLIPGNNGSPIFNSRGEVVGVVAGWVSLLDGGVASPEPIPYVSEGTIAYPITTVLSIKDEILSGKQQTGAWLGIEVRTNASRTGALVTQVEPGSPAARAGLRPGDEIVECDGKLLSDVRELQTHVSAAHPGESVRLVVLRDGKSLDMEIVLGERNSGRAGGQVSNHRAVVGYRGVPYFGRGTPYPNDPQFLEQRIRHLERELQALKTILRKHP